VGDHPSRRSVHSVHPHVLSKLQLFERPQFLLEQLLKRQTEVGGSYYQMDWTFLPESPPVVLRSESCFHTADKKRTIRSR